MAKQRSVCMVSTYLPHQPFNICSRYDKKEKSIIEIQRPNFVAIYYQNIGSVDLQDQMIALYRMAFWSKKYYQRMILHLIDMAIVNAWLLYRRYATNLGTQKTAQSFRLQNTSGFFVDKNQKRYFKNERKAILKLC